VRPVATTGVASIGDLPDRVDRAQIALLGDVVHFVTRSGTLPARRRHRAEEGIQFFRIHPDLAGVLEAELRSDAQRQVRAGEIDAPAGPA
jgi:methionyl-tRNA formyltransferase